MVLRSATVEDQYAQCIFWIYLSPCDFDFGYFLLEGVLGQPVNLGPVVFFKQHQRMDVAVQSFRLSQLGHPLMRPMDVWYSSTTPIPSVHTISQPRFDETHGFFGTGIKPRSIGIIERGCFSYERGMGVLKIYVRTSANTKRTWIDIQEVPWCFDLCCRFPSWCRVSIVRWRAFLARFLPATMGSCVKSVGNPLKFMVFQLIVTGKPPEKHQKAIVWGKPPHGRASPNV